MIHLSSLIILPSFFFINFHNSGTIHSFLLLLPWSFPFPLSLPLLLPLLQPLWLPTVIPWVRGAAKSPRQIPANSITAPSRKKFNLLSVTFPSINSVVRCFNSVISIMSSSFCLQNVPHSPYIVYTAKLSRIIQNPLHHHSDSAEDVILRGSTSFALCAFDDLPEPLIRL